ncbi:MAG: hypothetical protein E6Q81_01545 [Thermomonas sp.]|nr:MAG: hypothetical protein E6Q81_01545 [Thermomonas sp.]
MHASLRSCLPLALLVLAACSPKDEGQVAPGKSAADSPIAAANAEFARLRAQGPDATAREITRLEYALTRSLMKSGGLDAALGGEAKADAALTELFLDYERKARALQAELPKAFAPTNEGGGGSMGAEGWGGAAASSVLGGSQADSGVQAWMNGVDRGETSGHAESNVGGSSTSVDWTADSVTINSEVNGDAGGLKGKVKTTVSMKTCPDAEGKVIAEFESSSSVAAGGGSADSRVKSKVTAFVDDDANLIDDKIDSHSSAQQSTSGGAHVDASDDLSTETGAMGGKTNSMGGGATAEDGKMAQGMASMGRFAARQAILAAQKAWQSGQCVDLQVRSDPAKRKGAKPNTAYTLFAEPRAKSDGRPTGGTVKATLNGGNRLNPTGKVKADARFDYANPEKKGQKASIDFEARSKRGVGKAKLEFDTKNGYRIALDNGESITSCDITKPFSGKIGGGMITLSFTPTDDRSGRMAFHFANARGMADTTYSYTLSGSEDRMTGSFQSTGAVTGQGSGRRVSAAARKQSFSSTWTRIDDCEVAK